jgi:hypothetical protein
MVNSLRLITEGMEPRGCYRTRYGGVQFYWIANGEPQGVRGDKGSLPPAYCIYLFLLFLKHLTNAKPLFAAIELDKINMSVIGEVTHLVSSNMSA